MPLEEALDNEQRAAIGADQRAIAVLAGPGSGKTWVLSYRTRHLLSTDATTHALLLTFTNKAAAEMKSRAIRTTPLLSRRIHAGTFHNFGMSVLRNHGVHLGIPADFDVLDEQDQATMARLAAQAAGGANVVFQYSAQRLRRQLATAAVAAFGDAYERVKRDAGVLDFDDLIILTGQLFQRRPEIAAAYSTRYQFILVDEFQDTNNAQFEMIRPLAERARSISVFADDDQAIFGFAGAEMRNIRRFCDDLQATEYPLTTNYRCRAAIVECANRLIEANRADGRRMRAHKANGHLRAQVFDSVDLEAVAVCDDIQERIRSGVEVHCISVLTRSAFRVASIVTELIRRVIPHSNWLGASYNSQEQRMVRIGVAVSRPLLNERSRTALCELFGLRDTGVADTAALLRENAGIAGVEELSEARKLADAGARVSEMVRAVCDALRVGRPVAQVRANLIAEIVAFEQHDPDYSLDHFLGDLALGGRGGAPTEGGGVKVATLHRTKGLQWPHVYLIGLEEGTLPDYRSIEEEAIKEERRLCFVGVCRAEDSLTLTRVREYRGYGKQPSRFLREMAVA